MEVITIKKLVFCLCVFYFILSGYTISMAAGVNLSDTPSSWAVEQVNAAISRNLVPQNLQSNYTRTTTRAEFAALAVALFETVTSREIAERMEFNDTNDINVQKMGGLGVVIGMGDGSFAPHSTLTREQAAVMLSRLAEAVGNPVPRPNSPVTFTDRAQISSWAITSVEQVQTVGVMMGIGNGMFSPQGNYTREQSIVTILRLFEWLTESERNVSNVQVQYVADEILMQWESMAELFHTFVDLSQLDSYHEFVEFEEENMPRIAIRTDVPLRNFHFVEVDFGPEYTMEFMRANIIYSKDRLTPDVPFVVTFLNRGTLPHRGIVFFDEEHQDYRFFSIMKSGYDDSLFLLEANSGLLRSPRTAVTGILQDPTRAWVEITASIVTGWSHELQELTWDTQVLNAEDANRVFEILSTMNAFEVLTPFHQEGQHSDPVYAIEITFADGGTESISTTTSGVHFFRFTDTFGNHNDPGYVMGQSETLSEILATFFP